MIARFVGGPYDGVELDHNDINLYCRFTPIGLRKFVLMPPLADWKAVKKGDKTKEDQFDMLLSYDLVRTATGMTAYFDDKAERLSQASAEQRQGTQVVPHVPFTGAYYKCMRGDVDYLALEKVGFFPVTDQKGREWVCHAVSRDEAENPNILEQMYPVVEAQGKAHEQGFSRMGTKVSILHCESKEELPAKLADILD